ncbi:hypothetical protein PMAYCL1PPCAC_04336 [Pristionchus mayeri]|uniref:Uncharacterized protein n=1 Tax=Pristionchus mayeri TaxID=1317129 RepID=A0AAN4Z4Z5_9BILA|nr:hypothetical protein PMAYCL1PPCAC_04336 [Pristionchus mayeri]
MLSFRTITIKQSTINCGEIIITLVRQTQSMKLAPLLACLGEPPYVVVRPVVFAAVRHEPVGHSFIPKRCHLLPLLVVHRLVPNRHQRRNRYREQHGPKGASFTAGQSVHQHVREHAAGCHRNEVLRGARRRLLPR